MANSYNYNNNEIKIQVYDCKFVTVNANASTQNAVTPMVSTGPDWSYTWKTFTTDFPPCLIDTYTVTCAEGKENTALPLLCARGFQVNPSLTATATAALRSVQISPMTILA